MARRLSYRILCADARAGGHTVKLSRFDSSWALQLVLRPGSPEDDWRAVGVVFPDFEELDQHAAHLLAWLATGSPVEGGHR
jgi:hypothetical protein